MKGKLKGEKVQMKLQKNESESDKRIKRPQHFLMKYTFSISKKPLKNLSPFLHKAHKDSIYSCFVI